MDIINIKKQLRNSVREEILALSVEYIKSSNGGIFKRLLTLSEYSNAQRIMLYYSVDREPDTIAIATSALLAGKTVAFPYCYPGGKMDARMVDSLDKLVPAVLGIPAPPSCAPVIEPENLDLIIVPALLFDKSGYRLGYGGGYYDRYLSNLSAFTVGITRQKLLRSEIPREPHDVAVSCLITEENIFAQKPR